MCGNICYLMMTLNRFLLVGKDHSPWLVTLAKLEFKWVIRMSILFSVVLNIGHFWEYQPVDDMLFNYASSSKNTTYYYATSNIFDYINGYSYSDYPIANNGQSYFVFSIIYFCINFCVFFLVNTGIEAKLVWRMHKELKDKRERRAAMISEKSSSKEVASNSDQKAITTDNTKKMEEQEDEKKERRVIKMVVINGLLNFILRSPDMLFWMENSTIWVKLFKNVSALKTIGFFIPGFLTFIVDIGYFSYILTFTTNFIVFYFFNLKFREAVLLFPNSKPKDKQKC
jgi:hypothetical protein